MMKLCYVSVVKKMFWIDSSTTLALRVLCIISYVMKLLTGMLASSIVSQA